MVNLVSNKLSQQRFGNRDCLFVELHYYSPKNSHLRYPPDVRSFLYLFISFYHVIFSNI